MGFKGQKFPEDFDPILQVLDDDVLLIYSTASGKPMIIKLSELPFGIDEQAVLDLVAQHYINLNQKAAANGVATLDSGAKIPLTQIPDTLLGQVEYKGTWNAATNTPTLPTTPTEKGHYYVVSTAGTRFSLDFAVGDWIISNGTTWQKVDNTDAVMTVFGRIGNVVANAGDYSVFYLRHDTAVQGLTSTQKSNARVNIDVYSKSEGDDRYGRLASENTWLANQIITGKSTRYVPGASIPVIRVGGGNYNVDLIRVDSGTGIDDSSSYGFSIRYLGGGAGNNNALAIFSDNQNAASQIQALTVLQDGKIGVNKPIPTVELDIIGELLASGIATAAAIRTAAETTDYSLITRNSINSVLYVQSAATSGTRIIADFRYGSAAPGAGTRAMAITSLGVDVDGNILATGRVGARQTSSKYLKTKVKPIKNAFAILEKLRPINFSWNKKAKKLCSEYDDKLNFGFIAEELEEVLPSLIYPIHKQYKSIDQIQITPILVSALKELKGEFDELKSTVNDLKCEIEKLKKQNGTLSGS